MYTYIDIQYVLVYVLLIEYSPLLYVELNPYLCISIVKTGRSYDLFDLIKGQSNVLLLQLYQRQATFFIQLPRLMPTQEYSNLAAYLSSYNMQLKFFQS